MKRSIFIENLFSVSFYFKDKVLFYCLIFITLGLISSFKHFLAPSQKNTFETMKPVAWHDDQTCVNSFNPDQFSTHTNSFAYISQLGSYHWWPNTHPNAKSINFVNETRKIISIIQKFSNFIFSSAQAGEPTPETQISWPDIPGAIEYQIEILTKNKMEIVISETTQSPHYTWKNPVPGTFWFRVATKDIWGQQGLFSNYTKLSIKPSKGYLTPKTPRLYSPAHRSIVDLAESKDSLRFTWEDVGAQTYILLIARTLAFKDIVYKKSSDRSFLYIEPDDLLLEGEFYWRVVAEFPKGLTSLSLRRLLDFKGQKFLLPPPSLPAENVLPKKMYYDQPGWSLGANWIPASTEYKVKNIPLSAHAKGEQMSGLELEYLAPTWKDLWLKTKGMYQQAQFFSDLPFRQTSISFSLGKKWGFERMETTLYGGPLLSSITMVEKDGPTTLSARQLNSTSIAVEAAIKFNDILGYPLLLSYQTSIGDIVVRDLRGIITFCTKSFAYHGGLRIQQTIAKDDSTRLGYSETGPLLGISYPNKGHCP